LREAGLGRDQPAPTVLHHRSGGSSRRTPDLAKRNFTTNGRDQAWVADITYILSYSKHWQHCLRMH
jgi:hypothetical protein